MTNGHAVVSPAPRPLTRAVRPRVPHHQHRHVHDGAPPRLPPSPPLLPGPAGARLKRNRVRRLPPTPARGASPPVRPAKRPPRAARRKPRSVAPGPWSPRTTIRITNPSRARWPPDVASPAAPAHAAPGIESAIASAWSSAPTGPRSPHMQMSRSPRRATAIGRSPERSLRCTSAKKIPGWAWPISRT